MAYRLLVSAALLALLCAHLGDALECYECYSIEYSADDPTVEALLQMGDTGAANCDSDGFNADTTATEVCNANEDQCGKTDADLESEVLGVTFGMKMMFRGCYDSSEGDGEIGCDSSWQRLKEDMNLDDSVTGSGTGCACDTDLCNGAPTLVLTASALLMSALLALAQFM